MKYTTEQRYKIVDEFIDSINWTVTYQKFLEVKRLCDCDVINQKSPNQFRRWVEKQCHELIKRECWCLSTNCVRLEIDEDGWIDMHLEVSPEYECEYEEEFLDDNLKYGFYDSPKKSDNLIDYGDYTVDDNTDEEQSDWQECDSDMIPEKLSYEEFYQDIMKKMKTEKPKEWRDGQFVFNYIEKTYGDIARKVQFENRVDCFYRDEDMNEFINCAYLLYNSKK